MIGRPIYVWGLCIGIVFAPFGVRAATDQESFSTPGGKNTTELYQFIEHVIATHPELESATAALHATQSRAAGAKRSIYNPELELEAERADVSFFSVELSQTFDWRNKRDANHNEAMQWVQSAEMDTKFLQEKLASTLFSAITEIISAKQITDLARERVQLMEQFVELAESRLAEGDISQAELVTARLALSDAMVSLTKEKVSLGEAESGFYTIAGRALEANLSFPSLLPDKIGGDVDLQQLAELHPEIISTRQLITIARSRVEVVDRNRRADPDIGIKAGVENDEALVGLRFTMPLHVRNNFSDEVTAAHNEVVKVEQATLAIYRRVLGEIKRAKTKYNLLSQAWLDWQVMGQTSLNEHLRLLEQLWKSGEISTTEYLIQFQQGLDSKLSGKELQTQLRQSWIQWLTATGQVQSWLKTNSQEE